MTSTAKTVLFWIMTFLTGVLLYRAVQHGSSGRVLSPVNLASAKHMPFMRLGYHELLMIFAIQSHLQQDVLRCADSNPRDIYRR
jgi:hypothetical protein